MSQTFLCIPNASLLITGISILKPDVMATKGYSFQDDENTITDIDIDMDIVVQKEKNEWMRKMCLYFFFEKSEISELAKFFRRWKVTILFLLDETFNRRNILTDET